MATVEQSDHQHDRHEVRRLARINTVAQVTMAVCAVVTAALAVAVFLA